MKRHSGPDSVLLVTEDAIDDGQTDGVAGGCSTASAVSGTSRTITCYGQLTGSSICRAFGLTLRRARRGHRLTTGADIGVRLLVGIEPAARERAVFAVGLMEHWDMRLDPALVHRPVEHRDADRDQDSVVKELHSMLQSHA